MDADPDRNHEIQADLTLRFPGDRAIIVEWECPDEADQDVQLRFDRARDTVLKALSRAFADFQEVSSSGTNRDGHHELGDVASYSERE